MRITQLFTKTRREAPKDETFKNAQLLIRAGYIHKEMAGVYDYLPLGLLVIEKVKQIVREEMNAIGGQEMLMSSLQRREVWEKTDRWDEGKVDVWFKSALQSGTEVGFGWSHEEPITEMMREHIQSFRDLPAYVYQFQNKMRNELRAKSGIMRGREFLMKDLYSYSPDEESHEQFYEEVRQAYHRIFNRLGIGDVTYYTFASGGAFTQFSHEFQTICEAGEDTVYLDRKKGLAVNEEVMSDELLGQLGMKRDELEEVRSAEVGNIFSFGTTKSDQLDLRFTDQEGGQQDVVLGSYGIGITRVVGVLAELFGDEKGLCWPKEVAPYAAHLVVLGEDVAVREAAEKAYQQLTDEGISVLFDDREDISAGEKLSDADLLGMPQRLLISKKTIEAEQIEVADRTESETEMLELPAVVRKLKEA